MLSGYGSLSSSGTTRTSPMPSIMLLRLGSGLTLLYLHAWSQAVSAWGHLWNAVPWEMVTTLEQAGLPFPKVLATTAATLTAFAAVSWTLGFAVRFASTLFLPVTITALWVANRTDGTLAAELCILYTLISAALLISGAGWLSLDVLFQRKRKPKASRQSRR